MTAPGLRKDALPFENAVVWIAAVFGIISATAVVVTMVAIATQVVVRWVSGYSLPGLTELSQSCLVVSIFCALAWAAVRGEHVSVRLVTSRLPQKANRVIDIVVWAVSTLFMFWLTAAAYVRALESTEAGEAGPNISLVWYLWPWRWVMAIGLTVFTLVAITNLIRSLIGRMPYEDAPPEDQGHAYEDVSPEAGDEKEATS
ncbi:MAG: TRAP transporter small permease [Pseudoclavibacter sp.]